jgi:hypothetical protein
MFLKITEVAEFFCAAFHDKSFVAILTKQLGWVTIWAIFSQNSSGHPADHFYIVQISFRKAVFRHKSSSDTRKSFQHILYNINYL